MYFFHVFLYLEGVGPADFERLCGMLNPPAKAEIVEMEDRFEVRYKQYRCRWTLQSDGGIEAFCVDDSQLDKWVQRTVRMGGRVVRVRLGLPCGFQDRNEIEGNWYFEWNVHMTAKNRKNACRGLQRALMEQRGLSVRIARDCLAMASSNGAQSFVVTMRLRDMLTKVAMDKCRSLTDFLDHWHISDARVSRQPCGMRIVYDSNEHLDHFWA